MDELPDEQPIYVYVRKGPPDTNTPEGRTYANVEAAVFLILVALTIFGYLLP